MNLEQKPAPALLDHFPGLSLGDLQAFLRAHANLKFYFVTNPQPEPPESANDGVHGNAHVLYRQPRIESGNTHGNGQGAARSQSSLV